jgi:hypothetical protein
VELITMETDPIMSLRTAIEELTAEIRTMRGTGSAGASISSHSEESMDASESDDQELPVYNQAANDHGGTTPDDSTAALVADLNERVEEAQQKLHQLALELREDNEKLEVTRHNLSSTEQTLGELESQKAQLTEEIKSLEQSEKEFQILQQKCSVVEEHLRVLESEEVEFEAKSRLLTSREEGLRIGLEKVEHAGELMRKLWPEWLCGEDLRHWKELIERDVFSENSPPSFSLLFAAIHNYNASLRDPDNRIFLDALRDLGRRLYQWLKDLGKSEESTAEVVEAWAAAINAECEGRCAIQVAVPGNPANNKWMSFTPRSGSAPDVASVRSWCVTDNQGRPIHRAEVVV